MISGTKQRTAFWILGVLSLLLFAYTCVRSSTVCFTVDEAFTFQRYVKNSNWFPAEYDMHTANYHMLNTWLMIICSKIFGIAEWSLRLPNVLAYAVYLFFTAKFAMRSKETWSIVAVFVMLNVHPYLLDFFSVARGYGLSFGCLAGCLWYVTEYFSNGKQLKHLTLTLLFAGLAMWANFALLTVFVAIALIIFIALLFAREISMRKKLTEIGIGVGVSVLFVGIAYPVLSQLQDANAFFWNTSGFWKQTVCVLAAKLAYPLTGDIYNSPFAADLGMIASMSLAGIIIGYAFFRNRNSIQRTELLVLFTVLVVVIIEVVLQHLILDVPYPIGRTALFLFVIAICILAAALRDTMIPKKAGKIICALIVALQMFHAANTFNFSHASEWAYCADIRNALRIVETKAEPDKNSFSGVVLGYDQEFGNIINYYLQLEGLRNVSTFHCSENEDPRADLYIVSPRVKHAIITADTLLQYNPSELLILQSAVHGEWALDRFSQTNVVQKIDLPDATTNCELWSYTYGGDDTVSSRIDLQFKLVFAAPKTKCVIQFWHNRGDSLLWCGYFVIEAWPDDQSGMHTVNRNLPFQLQPNDIIHVSAVPFDDPGGPIEISQIKAHLQLSQ